MKNFLWSRVLSGVCALVVGMPNVNMAALIKHGGTEISINTPAHEEMITVLNNRILPQALNGDSDLTETFRVKGTLSFDDEEWKSLLRPNEFNGLIKLRYKLQNREDWIEKTPQTLFLDDPFRLSIQHDGDGAGAFEIRNIPKYMEVDGEYIPVEEYEIYVDYDSLPYYKTTDPICVTVRDQSQNAGTLKIGVVTSELEISPKIVPDDNTVNKSFKTDIILTNELLGTDNNDEPLSVQALAGGSNTVSVPVGLKFDVKQQPDDDYRFDGTYNYYVNGCEQSEDESFSRIIIEDQKIKVETVNFAQNQTVSFDVKWLDNNSPSRPKSTDIAEGFILEYQNEQGEFVPVTEENIALLDLTSVPKASYEGSTDSEGKYSFSGLPFVDSNGHELKYKVSFNGQLNDKYLQTVSTDSSGKQLFTFTEKTEYEASIVWNDESAENTRPSINEYKETLSLYRRVGNEIEPVPCSNDDFQIINNGNIWTVQIQNLPRYNENNVEYDYYLIQDPDKELLNADEKYKTFYDNGSGSYGNDMTSCHDGGKITQVLKSETEFSAAKEWLDEWDEETQFQKIMDNRPETIVTLWRYVKDENIKGIDDAYEKGQVSQVVFQTADNQTKDSDMDNILSYDLGRKNAQIDFLSEANRKELKLPEDYQLPKYDYNGREYVYFVRETLNDTDTASSDDYEIKYLGESGNIYTYGAPTDGKIQNVRREKAAISVEKIWKDPTGFSEIDGSSVCLEITDSEGKALKVYDPTDRSYDELTGDAKQKAQTVSGFTSMLPASEVIYYVNIYDETGHPIKMDEIQFQESVKVKNSDEWHDTDSKHVVHVGEKEYKAKTTLKDSGNGSNMIELGDGTKMYRYTQTNTLYAERDYNVIKEWDKSITDYSFIESVNFRLERCTIRDMLANGSKASFQPVPEDEDNESSEPLIVTVPKNDTRSWEQLTEHLPKYDNEGYEYYYRAVEAGFVLEDGSEKSLSDMGWSVNYHRNSNQTKAVNYISTSGGGYFTISKIWQDNGDPDRAKNVKLRVYEKSKLANALQEQNEENPTAAYADLNDIPFRSEIDLSETNDYSSEFSYKAGETPSQFIVIEYAIDGEPVQYEYTALDKVESDTYSYVGSADVKSKDRQYKVEAVKDPNSNDVFILNTRTGETRIKVEKIWKDENNSTKNRPSQIQFQLYQNGNVYTDIPDNIEIQSNSEQVNVSLDENGVVTLSCDDADENTLGKWEYTIKNLPQFSENGEICFYNIEEVVQAATENLSVTYIQKKTSPEVEEDGTTQTFRFNFTNIITGETKKIAYKIWQDVGVEDKESRPDLYFQLYRYLKKDGPEKAKQYNDYKAQVWNNQTDAEQHLENQFDWEIVIDELPQFDENGNEYGYYFTEEMNKGGATVYGKYTQTTTEKELDDGYGTKYQIFTNTLTDWMRVSGKKTWTGITGYKVETEEDYLPSPSIYLYRTTDGSVNTLYSNEDRKEFVEQNQLYSLESTVLNSGKNAYSFSKNYEKYDDTGARYYYFIVESFDDKNIELLYSQTNSNGTLINTFRKDVNRRQITVTKDWDNRYLDAIQQENQYPSVTFELYRYENEKENSALISQYTFPASVFKTNPQASHTFGDLLIYSPKGVKYHYYLKEKRINGYAEHEEFILVDDNGIDVRKPQAENDSNVNVINEYADNKPITLEGKKIWNDYGNAEGLRPDSIAVNLYRKTESQGSQNNAVEEVQVTLKSLPQEDENEKAPYIVWNCDADTRMTCDEWSYTIYNLERYAQNGMPYTYTLKEEKQRKYNDKELSSSVKVDSEKYGQFLLTNSFTETCYVKKFWDDGENQYNLRPDSVTIKLQSRAGNGEWQDMTCPVGYTTGQDYVNDKTISTLPSVLKNNEGKPIVSVTLTTENEKANTRHTIWEYYFKNLPAYNAANEKYEYQCVEVKVGSVDVNYESDPPKAGSYFCEAATDNGKTSITNALDKTSLVVTKNWDELGNTDMYQARPASIKFKLQKCGFVYEGSNVVKEFPWEDVCDKDGTAYEYTLSSANGWTSKLENLPVVQVLEGNVIYSLYYRAVEITREIDGQNRPVDALNYKELTDYTKSGSQNPEDSHYYDTEKTQNFSRLSNQLISDEKTITVNKKWYRSTATEKEAVFELLYSTDNKTWYCYSNNQAVSDTSKHVCTAKCLTQKHTAAIEFDVSKNEIKWEHLPKYNRAGTELYYKVIEHAVDGYATEAEENKQENDIYPTEYNFTNIEQQDYQVRKIWNNTAYAHKDGNAFTAVFQLQSQVEGRDEWENVGDEISLSSQTANAELQYTWEKLPKYTTDGKKIIYRAVETKINGKPVLHNTNGDYIVTYQYNNTNDAASFEDTLTTATNRMVYGFVNLSKAAAYLAPGVTSSDSNLSGVVFEILDDKGNQYVTDVTTDANGNLICNADGTYGKEKKYLVSGTYTLKEAGTYPDFSIWAKGVSFTVGLDESNATGEHGTAWICTDANTVEGSSLVLRVEYKHNINSSHSVNDACRPDSEASLPVAYNIESRGVIQFTKTGEGGQEMDTHGNAMGESRAYFGVYIDAQCQEQVAGMIASENDKSQFILTNISEDFTTTIPPLMNDKHIPYLRQYGTGYSLLSGKYYIKELIAPPGYKLDTNICVAEIAKISTTETNQDLSAVYSRNIAKINNTAVYKWSNIPNKVTIYKLDQYGRKVQLKPNQYLELRINSGTFPTGSDTIRLYQDSSKDNAYVKYNNQDGIWTITGLFDIQKTYTLLEPKNAVPDYNMIAHEISFKVDADGKMIDIENALQKNNPTETIGDDYENYYKSDAADNEIVIRDVSRYLNDVGIQKINSKTNQPIQYISFRMYKVVDNKGVSIFKDRNGKDANLLTTDADGKIQLSALPDSVINTDTGKPAKFGLDIGTYYLEEVEMGASDQYRLIGKVYFDIIKDDSDSNFKKGAKVSFRKEDDSEFEQIGNTGIVPNEPVTNQSKTLHLEKTGEAGTEKRKGARFTLTYTSINNTTGHQEDKTINCMTDENGILREATSSWNVKEYEVDISDKGHYVLTEIQAPDCYMTPTFEKVIIEFDVTTVNEISNVRVRSGSSLVTESSVTTENGEHTKLNLTIKNQETVVLLSKLNDIEGDKKTKNQKSLGGEKLGGAVLEIYECTSAEGTPVCTLNDSSDWTVKGQLKENTIYTLHEKSAPIGYMKADDIFFYLNGTNSKNKSNLYVWQGTGTPNLSNTKSWSSTANLKSNVLTMVDEAIIAPVDMQKVLLTVGSEYQTLKGAKFEVKDLDSNSVIGTAISNEQGWLVWESEPKNYGYIYDAGGKRITNRDTVKDTTIILQQNSAGYRFTEIYAPDNAYNEGKSWTVNITEQNYRDYKTNGSYDTDKYIDILHPDAQTLSSRISTVTAEENDLVNPEYKSRVQLNKYDSDVEADFKAIPNTEFTLYRDGSPYIKAEVADNKGTRLRDGVFMTDSSGVLQIEIYEKGTYTLKETAAAIGYILDESTSFTFTLQDKSTASDKESRKYGYDETNTLSIDVHGVPNERKKGDVTLVKKDKDSDELLNGVVYRLERITPPQKQNGDDFEDYLLNDNVDVETGKAYIVSGNTVIEDTNGSNKDGTIVISGLNWGEYKLTEVKENSGYKLGNSEAEQYSFTISNENLKENNLTISGNKIFTGNDTITNIKNQVTFKKTNMVEEGIFTEQQIKGLAGAVFEVLDASREKVAFYASPNASEKVSQVTSGTDGEVTIYGLPTDIESSVPKPYYLHEVTAPKGYKLQNEDIAFTIERSGDVKIDTQSVNKVTMQDEAIKIYLEKLGEDDFTHLRGAVFTLKDANGEKLANGTDSEIITIDTEDGKLMIPVERVIGGHTYTLTETKAPDGYECTVEITFTVKTDGTLENIKSSGGHSADGGCVTYTQTGNKPTLHIHNEKIRAQILKVDAQDHNTFLNDVQFTLKPQNGSRFSDGSTEIPLTTDEYGVAVIEDGLLVHDNEYVLYEVKTMQGYYIYRELKDGLRLTVNTDGSITVHHDGDKYKTECPVTARNDNTVILTVNNMKSASFTLQKKVDGNMGDLSGIFGIQMTVYENENDTAPISQKDVDLKLNETYDSENGKLLDDTTVPKTYDEQSSFGNDAIPVGSVLEIKENNDLDYEAVVRIVNNDGTIADVINTDKKGIVRVKLNSNEKIQLELVNRKNAIIDVGVSLKDHALLAMLALMVPTAWLYLRFRKKRREEMIL